MNYSTNWIVPTIKTNKGLIVLIMRNVLYKKTVLLVKLLTEMMSLLLDELLKRMGTQLGHNSFYACCGVYRLFMEGGGQNPFMPKLYKTRFWVPGPTF